MDTLKKCLFTTLVATVLLLIATKSSPLYPLNDWVDANAIFTVGKGMMDGTVVYKDIFEQKGPALYAIHGVGSLISHNTFLGMYLLEVVAFSCFLFFALKIMSIYVSKHMALVGTVLTGFLIVFVTNFVHGNSAEEYCLPLLAISMYHLLYHLRFRYTMEMPTWMVLFNGILAGCVVWIKYSMIGYWFGWMLVLLFSLVLLRKFGTILKTSIVFLLGMALSGVPWVLYFIENNGLNEFIDVYFITNIKYYSDSGSLLNNLIIISGKIILVYFKNNIIFAAVFVTGLVGLLFTNLLEGRWLNKMGILVPFLFLFLSVYGGGIRLDYYFQIMTPLVLFGVVVLLKLLKTVVDLKDDKIAWMASSGLLVVLFCVLYFTHHNTYLMKIDKEDLFQYKFASYLNKHPNATLLNYGFLDMGVHNTANIAPTVYYFMKHNFDYDVYPFDVDAQNSYLTKKVTDFVVVKTNKDKAYKNPFLDKGYKPILEQEQFYEDKVFNYVLYKKR